MVAPCEFLARVARDDWSVVEEVHKAATVLGENDLLLGSLNGGSEVDVVCLLNLLTRLHRVSLVELEVYHTNNIGQLRFCDQVLSLCSDELLLKDWQLWAGRLFVLQLLDLVADLGLLVSAWLHTLLSVSDLLQDATIVFQILRKQILLLANLRHDHTKLIGDVTDSIVVGGLTPVG